MKEIGNPSVHCQQCLSGIVNGLTGSWSLLILDDEFISDCNHITYLPRVTSAEFRSNSAEEKYVALIVIVNILQISFSNFSKPSSCDSRNLNLSPFCNLTSTSLAMWQPSVLETYGNLTTTYINKTTGPLRPKYPGSMGDRELISSLTKVC